MIDKKLKQELITELNTIFRLTDKLADFYKNPHKISDIRNMIFIRIGKLRELIK